MTPALLLLGRSAYFEAVPDEGRPEREHLEKILSTAEAAEGPIENPVARSFYRAIGVVRRRPDLAKEFGNRIAAIDRRLFESKVKLRVPVWVGSVLLGGGTLAALAALLVARRFAEPLRTVVFLGGFGLLIVAPHSLTHWLVGRAMGIRFISYFLGGPPPPRPGVKTDYATYLSVSPRRRAIMHASGAIVTKAVPFGVMPVAAWLDLDVWVWIILWVVGIGQIATDILFSTRSSDWKKVIRELRAARGI